MGHRGEFIVRCPCGLCRNWNGSPGTGLKLGVSLGHLVSGRPGSTLESRVLLGGWTPPRSALVKPDMLGGREDAGEREPQVPREQMGSGAWGLLRVGDRGPASGPGWEDGGRGGGLQGIDLETERSQSEGRRARSGGSGRCTGPGGGGLSEGAGAAGSDQGTWGDPAGVDSAWKLCGA